MATVNLSPNADISNDWNISLGVYAYAMLSGAYISAVASDASYISQTSSGSRCYLNFDDFTAPHSAINSIQVITVAGNNTRGASYELTTRIGLSTGGFLYTEGSGSQSANIAYQTQLYTTRTTSDGSTAWSNSDLNDLRVRIDLSAHSAGTTQCTNCVVVVDYDLPVSITDNAILFGANF